MDTLSSVGNNTLDGADLLTRSDATLELLRCDLLAQIGDLSSALRMIVRAQITKRRLQQHNLVAIRTINPDKASVSLDIMALPDAIYSLENQPLALLDQAAAELNKSIQYSVWSEDGYDLPGSAALR